MTYKKFDVVVIPFPFSDQLKQKKRPVLVISTDNFNRRAKHIVTLMITSAQHSKWPLDTPIQDLKTVGLPTKYIVRMKFFIADISIVQKKIGRVSAKDQKRIENSLSELLE